MFLKVFVGSSRGILWIKTERLPWGLLKGSAVTSVLGLCYDLCNLSPCQEEAAIQWDHEGNAADSPGTSCMYG